MINIPKFFKQEEDDEVEVSKLVLPLLPLRDIVVFPHMVAPLFVGRTKSVNALSDAMNNDKTHSDSMILNIYLTNFRDYGI